MRKLLIITMFCWVGHVFAVPKPVAGLVLDAETNKPLPFTSIVVTGQGRGTIANAEGVFVLNLEAIDSDDSITFSHVGYETLTIAAGSLRSQSEILLRPATINLSEVAVYSRQLTAEEIIAQVVEQYPENYPVADHQRRMFFHKYEKTKFPDKNQIVMKKSDFAGLNKEVFNELLEKLPEEFVEYQDVLVELYHHQGDKKLVPVDGISLEESSMQDLSKEFEEKLGAFLTDIEQTNSNEDVYYKFRTGIFAFDADMDGAGDTTTKENELDSTHYTLSTGYIKGGIDALINNYASLGSDNWEFLHKTRKYKYAMSEMTIFDDEVVYQINFTPKRGGLFEGVMYVSAATFAILQLDFAYAPGKSSENIQLLGFGHSMNYKKGRVIFERGEDGYYLKYIYAEQHETASIERALSFMKKEKRFLWDKTLNEMKIDLEMYFDIKNNWELLVMDKRPISEEQFVNIAQPKAMKLKKLYAYSPEMWENSTVIAPTAELKKYKRKE